MNSEKFRATVAAFKKNPKAMSEIGIPREHMARIAAWLVSVYGDVAVSVTDFHTEESRLELAKRVGQQEIALAAVASLNLNENPQLEE
jgi:hypothetical protein